MRFLPEERVTPNIIPLNFIYDRGEGFGNDSLTIIFKDNETNMKDFVVLKQPQIEIYIVKPEFREGMTGQSRHWFPISQCDKYTVPYQSRFHEAAKILGLNSSEDAKLSPFLYGADIEVENFYLIEFIREYHYDGPKKLSMGYFDIENDIIRINGFPEHGQVPINAVTFIDGENNWVYTLLLATGDIPIVSEQHPKYLEYKEMREHHDEEVMKLNDHIPQFIEYLHDKYDDIYGRMEYSIAFFTDEIQLVQTLWQIMRESNNDYIYAWNLPYDMQHNMTRPGILGYDVNEIIPDPKLKEAKPDVHVFFKEDTNPKAGRRRHQCNTWTLQTFLDQMVIYAGIRGGRGELASTKLNYVAQLELQHEKLDYSEDGDLRTLPYRNFYKFVEYNINDVLLQYGIENKTHDMQTIYSRLYTLGVLPNQAFTTTKVVLYALYMFGLDHGYILGQNRNKGHKNNAALNYGDIFNAVDESTDDDEYFDLIFGDTDDEELSEEDEEKREKYAGAFVMNPLYLSPTGFTIRGKPSKYVHEHVADEDVTSEYPSAIIIANISSETLVGRVFFEGEPPDIPVPPAFEFRGDEAVKYKMDPANFMLEMFSERDYQSFAHTFLGLPSFSEVCDLIESGEV